MLAKTRVSRQLDTVRLAETVSRPGVDPRVWVSLASVVAVNVEQDQGVFVDVMLMPIGNEETVIMGLPYAGDGFGDYCPIEKDDTIVVMFPSGDPNEGGIIVARFWDNVDKPAQEAVDNPSDRIIKVKDGNNLRLLGNGASVLIDKDGNVNATSKDGANAVLEGKNATVSAAAPDGVATVTATAVTGAVKLGPVGNLQVLVLGAMDSLGVPVTQAPAAVLSIVKAG